MPIYSAPLTGGTSANAHRLDLHLNQDSQSVEGNSSVVSFALYLVHVSGSPPSWRGSNDSTWGADIGGNTSGGPTGYDFRGNPYGSKLLGAGTYTIHHRADGTADFNVAGSFSTPGNIGSAVAVGNITLTPIPRMPSEPRTLAAASIGASTVGLTWVAPANIGGSPLIEYQVYYQTPATSGSNFTAGRSTTLTGLTPGISYTVNVRARNSQGWSPWSNTITVRPILPAPSFSSWAQNSAGNLVATWSPPAPATALTGYRLQVATDPLFTQGVQLFDLGNVLTYTYTGGVGGRAYYARVAPLTAGGVNTFSASRSTVLVLDAGDLDGWSRVGTKPAQISYFTVEGIRRGTIGGTRQALMLESLSTASVTLAADTFGIQRTVTGLTPGKAYRFQANATHTAAAAATQYRLRVISEASSAPVTVYQSLTDLGYIEFIADASTAVIQILMAATAAVSGAVENVERIGFTDIKLLALATDYAVRLRETVYESNLANHFDLACNSVGASWYVGKDGVTRFRLPGAALPVTTIFSDEPSASDMHYIDVAAAYDTRELVNRLDVTNYGVDDDRDNEENENLIVSSSTSIAAYGVRSARLDTNLWDLAPYDETLANRLGAILAASAEPQLLVKSFRWNAQESLSMALALDVGQRITVRHRGTDQDSQIVSLAHDITPTRWIITATLQRL